MAGAGEDRRLGAPVLAGRYRLGRVLGRGGMAVVYDGIDGRLDRPVAVKVLRAELAADAGLRIRFEAEARSAARLVHPNVVSVFDTGDSGGRPYIVMERLSGESLADVIRAGQLGAARATRIGAEVLAALSMAHAAGMIHRDVKPGNILMAGDGSVKVADFGIAKGLEPLPGQPADLTATAMLMGTPAYLAPERLAGEPATVPSDLWAVGVVLYEVLAGTKPFVGATPLAVAGAIQHIDPIPLVEHRPDLGPAVVATVTRALARLPEDRFESATQMADALVGRGLPVAAAATGTVTAGLDPTVALPGEPVADVTSVLTAWAVLPEGAGLADGGGLAGTPTPAVVEDRRVAGSPGRPGTPVRRSTRTGALAIAVLALALLAAVVAIVLQPSSSRPSRAPTSPPSTSLGQATMPTTTSPPAAHRSVPTTVNRETTTSVAATMPATTMPATTMPATTASPPTTARTVTTTTVPTTITRGPNVTTPPAGPGGHGKGPSHLGGKGG